MPGRGARTPARARRCCSPPESVVERRRSKPAKPTASSASGTRVRIAAGGQPRFSSPKATSSSTRSMTSWLAGSWKTIPTRAATAVASAVVGSRPATRSRPLQRPGNSRGIRPAMARARLLLPDPDGPTTRRHSPGSRRKETSAKAGRGRPAYWKPIASASMVAGRPTGTGTVISGRRPTRRWSERRLRTCVTAVPADTGSRVSGRRRPPRVPPGRVTGAHPSCPAGKPSSTPARRSARTRRTEP
jgi:hypothetical protein